MNYTPEQIKRINRLIATKIEGWKQSEQVELLNHKDEKYIGRLWLNGDGDEMDIVNEHSPNYCFPQYHKDPAALLRAVEKVTESGIFTLSLLNFLGDANADIYSEEISYETGEFTGPGRIAKALYTALAQFVLGMEGGGECQ